MPPTSIDAPEELEASDEDLSVVELKKKIGSLRELVRKKEGQPTREMVREWLSPESEDFMGLGMSLQEFVAKGEIERFQRAFVTQSRVEQSRRFELVLRLCVYLAGLREANVHFCMRIAECSIMNVIDGDYASVAIDRQILLAEVESDQKTRDYAAITFGPFVKILDEAIATAPRPDDAEATRH